MSNDDQNPLLTGKLFSAAQKKPFKEVGVVTYEDVRRLLLEAEDLEEKAAVLMAEAQQQLDEAVENYRETEKLADQAVEMALDMIRNG